MQDIINEFLEWKATHAARASINYRIWLERFAELHKKKTLQQITVNDTVLYNRIISARFSPASVQFATIALKGFFKFCQDSKYKCISPSFIRVKVAKAKSHRALQKREYEKILSVLEHNDFLQLRDLLIIRMLWDTGVRVSELCDINIGQIKENKRHIFIATKKTNQHRVIVWSKRTHQFLLKYLPIRRELKKSDALFVGFEKKRGWSLRLTPRSIQRIVRHYATLAGIKERITPHSFRHGWAHVRRDKKAPHSFIQKAMGHRNAVSTLIYEQFTDIDFVSEADRYLINN